MKTRVRVRQKKGEDYIWCKSGCIKTDVFASQYGLCELMLNHLFLEHLASCCLKQDIHFSVANHFGTTGE